MNQCFKWSWLVISVFVVLKAEGAIYKCIDSKGNASYSQKPCPMKKITGNSREHELWKTLKVLSKKGRGIVLSVGPDINSIKACKVRAEKYNQEVMAIKSRIDDLGKQYQEMKAAYRLLSSCGVCQARGASHCAKVDRHLEKAKNVLVKVPVKEPPPWARKRRAAQSE